MASRRHINEKGTVRGDSGVFVHCRRKLKQRNRFELRKRGAEHAHLKSKRNGGPWVAQSVKRPTWVKRLTSAQVMILGFEPGVGSVLSGPSLLRILCLPLALPLSHLRSLSQK